MASSKAPKHDFAPAWLKIPDHGIQKSSDAKSSELHSDKLQGGSYMYGRRRPDMMPPHPRYDYNYSTARARNYDPVYDDRMFGKQQFRSHGMEEDYYNNGYYGGYPPSPGYRGNFAGQPSSRFYGQQMSMYPPSPYGVPYDQLYAGERTQGRSGTPRRLPRAEKESRSKLEKCAGAEADKQRQRGEKPVDTPPLDEEFPSLNGEAEAKVEKVDTCKAPAGVWDKNSLEKITNHSKTNENCASEVKHNTNIYKALVPSKSKGVSASRSGKENNSKLSLNKDTAVNGNGCSTPPSVAQPRNNKERSVGDSVSAPLDILNTRTVTQPRTLADKKSDFIKALKQQNDLNYSNTNGNAKCLENGVDSAVADIMQSELSNGLDDLELAPPPLHTNGGGDGRGLLSSSLEAEQRLLREMGWSEEDEENPITEEEIREIQQLQTRIKQLKEQKNGFKKTSPMTWSAQHVSSPSLPATRDLLARTCLSCSDSDSDS